ncbi:hypothetical protein DSO57_1008238 [Entomophthora muscae]|uniref:Uncharacterized protein n=2 Tax=Entomophthora muscae TaxID=34485 RepID=A0ACC2TIB0_9FUNG|nr:hypothetical protein DSO57_1008237 [Entomophthora muscae]KAJ9074251.1 hypothetical protein DSO57_1008238 [Entomophthora muscae]
MELVTASEGTSVKPSEFRLWTNRREFLNTSLVAAWVALCLYVVCLANAYLDRINPSLYSLHHPRLPDPLLDFLSPYYLRSGLAPDLADQLVQFGPVFILLRPLLMREKALLVLRRQFFIIGACYLVRAVFVLITILPNPLASCKTKLSNSIFYDAFLQFIQLRTSCGDVLFSGHTIVFLISALSWSTYPFSLITTCIAWAFASLGIMVLIASTYHYTVDCVVGVMVVSLIWKLYHSTVTSHHDNSFSKLLYQLDAEHHFDIEYERCRESEYP